VAPQSLMGRSILGEYWVEGDIFTGCHTRYQYCSNILMPAVWQLPADDGREIEEEEK